MVRDSDGGPNPIRAPMKAKAPKQTPVNKGILNTNHMIGPNWIR